MVIRPPDAAFKRVLFLSLVLVSLGLFALLYLSASGCAPAQSSISVTPATAKADHVVTRTTTITIPPPAKDQPK